MKLGLETAVPESRPLPCSASDVAQTERFMLRYGDTLLRLVSMLYVSRYFRPRIIVRFQNHSTRNQGYTTRGASMKPAKLHQYLKLDCCCRRRWLCQAAGFLFALASNHVRQPNGNLGTFTHCGSQLSRSLALRKMNRFRYVDSFSE